jgi:hypothetical protein
MEGALMRNSTGWLVGGKCTYTDSSFVTRAVVGEGLLRELDRADKLAKYPDTLLDFGP